MAASTIHTRVVEATSSQPDASAVWLLAEVDPTSTPVLTSGSS